MRCFLSLLWALLLGTALCAQQIDPTLDLGDSTQTHRLRLHNGEVLLGRVLAFAGNGIRFRHLERELSIALAEIAAIEVLGSPSQAPAPQAVPEPAFRRPLPTERDSVVRGGQLLLGFHAIPQRRGQLVFSNSNILINRLDYSITDNVSVGASLLPYYGVGFRVHTAWALAPYVYAGASGYVTVPATEEAENVGLYNSWGRYVQGSLSIGTPSDYVSIGGGLSSWATELGEAEAKPYFLHLGGRLDVGDDVDLTHESFLSANGEWLSTTSFGLSGGRRDRSHFDVGFSIFRDSERALFFPYVGMTATLLKGRQDQ